MNLIFDFDGTICNSIKPTVDVVNEIFSETGYKQTDIKEVKRIGLKGLIKSRKISPFKVHKFVSDYRIRNEKIYETALPFKGIVSSLKKLSRIHKLGILTTNQTRIVKKFVNKHKFNFFSFVHSEKSVFGKDNGLKKIVAQHSLNPEETYYIGDETRDIEAAKRQKVKTIAVTWGAESKNLLRKANPDIIISEPKGLLSL